MYSTCRISVLSRIMANLWSTLKKYRRRPVSISCLVVMYRISPIISRTFLHERSEVKNGVRLAITMRLTFEIFVESPVRHAIAFILYTKRHILLSPHLVEGIFSNEMMAVRIEGLIIECDLCFCQLPHRWCTSSFLFPFFFFPVPSGEWPHDLGLDGG